MCLPSRKAAVSHSFVSSSGDCGRAMPTVDISCAPVGVRRTVVGGCWSVKLDRRQRSVTAGAVLVQVFTPSQEFGGKIGAVGPNYSLRVRIEPHLSEEVDISQRLEDLSPELRFEVKLASISVSERDSNSIARDVLNAGDNDGQWIVPLSIQARGGIFWRGSRCCASCQFSFNSC